MALYAADLYRHAVARRGLPGFERTGKPLMSDRVEYYDIAVLSGDETIASELAIALHSPRAAWPRIAEIARKIDAPDCRIRVTDQSGHTVILVGVATARRYFEVGL